MVRKRESVAEREARERMRDRYDLEVKAVVEFFGYAGQIDQLHRGPARVGCRAGQSESAVRARRQELLEARGYEAVSERAEVDPEQPLAEHAGQQLLFSRLPEADPADTAIACAWQGDRAASGAGRRATVPAR